MVKHAPTSVRCMAERRVAVLILIASVTALILPAPATSAGTASVAGWPDIEQALLRPGIAITANTECTANFVLATPNNATLFLATAATCVRGLKLGDPVDLAGVATGILAYSSHITMDARGENNNATRAANDFALIEVPDTARPLVHPALLHYGGPTGLARTNTPAPTPLVHAYGASTLTPPGLAARDGAIVARTVWTSTVYLAAPALPGDGGAGVILHDGRALGSVSTLNLAPLAGSVTVTHLDIALHYAQRNAGMDVHLATWPLL